MFVVHMELQHTKSYLSSYTSNFAIHCFVSRDEDEKTSLRGHPTTPTRGQIYLWSDSASIYSEG